MHRPLAGSGGCKLFSIKEDKGAFSLYNEKILCSDTIIDMSVSHDCKYLAYAISNKVDLYAISSFDDHVEKCNSQALNKITSIACGNRFFFTLYDYFHNLALYEYDTKKISHYDLKFLSPSYDCWPRISCSFIGNKLLFLNGKCSAVEIEYEDNKFKFNKRFTSPDRILSTVYNYNDSIVALNDRRVGYILCNAKDRSKIATIGSDSDRYSKVVQYASIVLYENNLAAVLQNNGKAIEFWHYAASKELKCILKIGLNLQTILKTIEIIDNYNVGSKLLVFSPNAQRFVAAAIGQIFMGNIPLKAFCSKEIIKQFHFSLWVLINSFSNSLGCVNNDIIRLIIEKLIDFYKN